MSATVKAYYDGTVFFPMMPLSIQTGKVFMLSVLQEDEISTDTAKKVLAFRHITNNLRKIDNTEPLSPEFDEILSHRVHFNTEINL
jgi:hypothetical protein